MHDKIIQGELRPEDCNNMEVYNLLKLLKTPNGQSKIIIQLI